MHATHAPAPALRILVGFGESAAAAAQALGEALLALPLFVAGRVLGLRLFRRGYLGALERRSQALRGARIRMLRKLRARDPRDRHTQLRHPREFWWVEVAVRPRRQRGAPVWRPKDLALVAPDADPRRPEGEDQLGEVHGTALWDGKQWRYTRHQRQLVGPQRVLLLVSLRPGARRFRFRYYLELLRREAAPAQRVVAAAKPAPSVKRRSAPAPAGGHPAKPLKMAAPAKPVRSPRRKRSRWPWRSSETPASPTSSGRISSTSRGRRWSTRS